MHNAPKLARKAINDPQIRVGFFPKSNQFITEKNDDYKCNK